MSPWPTTLRLKRRWPNIIPELVLFLSLVACKADPRGEAERALTQGDVSSAVALLEPLATAPGADVSIRSQYGIALYRAGRLQEAAQILGAITPPVSDPEAIVAITRAQVMRGEARGAISVLEQLVRNHPEDARVQAALADAYAQAGQLEKARARFQHAATLDPNLASAQVGLGDLALTDGDRVGAKTNYERAVALGGQGADGVLARARLARLQAAMGDGRAAQALVQESLALQPEHPAAQAELGKLLVQMGFYDEALPMLQKAQADLGDEPEVMSYLGFVFLQRSRTAMMQADAYKDLHSARMWLERTVKRDPLRASVWANLGQVQAELGDVEGAQVSFQKVQEIDPRNVDGLLNLGQLYAKEGQSELARQSFEKVISIYADHVVAQMNLGVLALREGDLSLAQTWYNKAALTCAETPLDHPCRMELAYNLARVYSRQGQIEGAVAQMIQAFTLGFRDLGRLKAETDLGPVRADIRVANAIDALTLAQAPMALPGLMGP